MADKMTNVENKSLYNRVIKPVVQLGTGLGLIFSLHAPIETKAQESLTPLELGSVPSSLVADTLGNEFSALLASGVPQDAIDRIQIVDAVNPKNGKHIPIAYFQGSYAVPGKNLIIKTHNMELRPAIGTNNSQQSQVIAVVEQKVGVGKGDVQEEGQVLGVVASKENGDLCIDNISDINNITLLQVNYAPADPKFPELPRGGGQMKNSQDAQIEVKDLQMGPEKSVSTIKTADTYTISKDAVAPLLSALKYEGDKFPESGIQLPINSSTDEEKVLDILKSLPGDTTQLQQDLQTTWEDSNIKDSNNQVIPGALTVYFNTYLNSNGDLDGIIYIESNVNADLGNGQKLVKGEIISSGVSMMPVLPNFATAGEIKREFIPFRSIHAGLVNWLIENGMGETRLPSDNSYVLTEVQVDEKGSILGVNELATGVGEQPLVFGFKPVEGDTTIQASNTDPVATAVPRDIPMRLEINNTTSTASPEQAFQQADVQTSLDAQGNLTLTINGKQTAFPKEHNLYLDGNPEVKWGVKVFSKTDAGTPYYRGDGIVTGAELRTVTVQKDKNSQSYTFQLPVLYVILPRPDGTSIKTEMTGLPEVGGGLNRRDLGNWSPQKVVDYVNSHVDPSKNEYIRTQVSFWAPQTTAQVKAGYAKYNMSCEPGSDCDQAVAWEVTVGQSASQMIAAYNNRHFQGGVVAGTFESVQFLSN